MKMIFDYSGMDDITQYHQYSVNNKDELSRVFRIIGIKGLLSHRISPDTVIDLSDRARYFVITEYAPERESLENQVKKLICLKYPHCLANGFHNGKTLPLSDKTRDALSNLFFCYKRRNGGLRDITEEVLLALIDETEQNSLNAETLPVAPIPYKESRKIVREIITSKKDGTVNCKLYEKIPPDEMNRVIETLKKRREMQDGINRKKVPPKQEIALINGEDIIFPESFSPEDDEMYMKSYGI